MAELPNTLLGLRRALAQGSLSVPEALQAQRQRVRALDAVYGCVVSIPDEPQPDFRLDGEATHGIPGLVTMFGIESPGLTSSLAIGESVSSLLP